MSASGLSSGVRSSYRSVFISDLHLGSVGCRPREIVDFLDSVECEKLYLVGDIVDGWVGTSRGKWRNQHNLVIRALLEFGNRGSEVYYCPGNHDATFRRFSGYEVGAIIIDHQFVHERVDGSKWLVVHGDLFDRTVTRFPRIAYVGAWSHEWLAVLDIAISRSRSKRGKSEFRIADRAKTFLKRWIKRKSRYDELILEYARSIDCAGVVCGHTHKPTIQQMEDGMFYVNSGDWVEHCTAIVEHHDGRCEIVWWPPLVAGGAYESGQELEVAAR